MILLPRHNRHGCFGPLPADKESVNYEISSPDFPGERLVACRNPALAKERARKRVELLQATERRLTRIANEVRRKPAKHDAGVIGLAVGEP